MKIHPVGDELFNTSVLTDGQTDMMKLIFAFRNFANAPNQQFSLSVDTEPCTPFDSQRASYTHTRRIFIVSPCIFIYLLVFTNICTFIVIKLLHKQSLM